MCADTEHDWPTPGQGVDSVKPRQYELLRAYCALAHAVAQVRAEQASLAYPPFVIFIDHFDLMMMRVNEQPTPHKTAGILHDMQQQLASIMSHTGVGVGVVLCGMTVFTLGRMILDYPAATRQTTTLGTYITEQAEAYTPALTNVECETPATDNKNTLLEQEGRYLRTWRFDGKPVKGSVSIATSKATGWFSSTPPTATLVDSHGGVWCPVEWKTSNGCEPVSKPPEAS